MSRGPHWREDEDKILRHMWAMGFSARNVAERVSRPIDSVRNRVKLLGISRRVIKVSKTEQIVVRAYDNPRPWDPATDPKPRALLRDRHN